MKPWVGYYCPPASPSTYRMFYCPLALLKQGKDIVPLVTLSRVLSHPPEPTGHPGYRYPGVSTAGPDHSISTLTSNPSPHLYNRDQSLNVPCPWPTPNLLIGLLVLPFIITTQFVTNFHFSSYFIETWSIHVHQRDELPGSWLMTLGPGPGSPETTFI
jgi:hypothetical protein